MGVPFEYTMSMPPMDQYDPAYSFYDQQYGTYQRISGPPTPHEGFAFWYRPDPHAQDTMYQRDAPLYGRAMPIQAMNEPQSIKHRRTRSGCFTCRTRRVKCDETRPICERCRKGNRECEFPQSSSSSRRIRTSESKSALGENATEGNDRLDTIKDESEDESGEDDEEPQSMAPPSKHRPSRPKLERVRTGSLSASGRPPRSRHQSNASINSYDRASPSTEATDPETPFSPPNYKPQPPASPDARWKRLKPDLKPEMSKYLEFQRDHMTYYHYLFKLDPEDFVHREFIDLALKFEPLLYAVIAFAAYHHTVRLPDGDADFNSFWKYYCKSIVTLRKFLEAKHDRDDLVLLTVLQLATFEEYMGDWTNLVAHHKAAHGILTSRYTPEQIMKTDRGRKIFDWYVRLDVIAGMMAVRDLSLGRSWLSYSVDWYRLRIKQEDADISNTLECFSKGLELVAADIAHLFAQANEALARGELSLDDVLGEVKQMHHRLDDLRKSIQELNDPDMAVIEQSGSRSTEDAFDADVPLFRGKLWPLNFVWIDWYGVYLLLKQQTLFAIQKARLQNESDENGSDRAELPREVVEYAKVQCQIYNAIALSSDSPAGATLLCYTNLGLSTVFLSQAPPESDIRFNMWARRQLANIEREGYIWPPSYRKELAALWNDPSVEAWWLPDGEGKLKILDEIRAVVEDRIAIAKQGPDDGRADLREIKGLFEKMDLTGGTQRHTGAGVDPSYINSSAGMANAASMVSTPEDGSSAGSANGFSPHTSLNELGSRGQTSSRRNSRGNAPAASRDTNRMSGIWPEQR